MQTLGTAFMTTAGAALSVVWAVEGGWDKISGNSTTLSFYLAILLTFGIGAGLHLVGNAGKQEEIALPNSGEYHIEIEHNSSADNDDDTSGGILKQFNHPVWLTTIAVGIGYLMILALLAVILFIIPWIIFSQLM